jgi:hypothetical protein
LVGWGDVINCITSLVCFIMRGEFKFQVQHDDKLVAK